MDNAQQSQPPVSGQSPGAGVPATVTPQPESAAAPAPGQSFEARVHDFESRLPSLGEALSSVASFIPGFAGYKSTEDRRIADKQLRGLIGERLSAVNARLDSAVETLTRAGNLDSVALIDQSSRRLERLIDRMRFADYGYAAVFDRVQLGDAELARIYDYDAAILSELGKFDAAASELEQGLNDGAAARAALVKLDGLTAEFDRRFEGRKHLFDGLPTA